MGFPFAASFNTLRARRVHNTSPYALLMKELPPGLYDNWATSAHNEFEGIPRTPFFFARAAEGLLMFFDCVHSAGERCALPSKAADSVWHAWQSYDPVSLEAFCIRHFDQPIPHVTADEMEGGMARSLAVCLVQARKLERLQLAGRSLPRLFRLDDATRMPLGHGYRMKGGLVAYGQLDRDGDWPGQRSYPASLRPTDLLSLGLVSFADYSMITRPPAPSDYVPFVPGFFGDGGNGCVDGSGSSSCADAGATSGASCGGGSSGASCGGGGCGGS